MIDSEFEKSTSAGDVADVDAKKSKSNLKTFGTIDLKLVPRENLQLPPYSAICQLTMTFPGVPPKGGSGFLVGNGMLMATAGHNLKDTDLGQPRKIEVVVGGKPLAQPLGPESFKASKKWLDKPIKGAPYDYGFIILPVRFNVSFALEPSIARVKQISSATIAGYPCSDPRVNFPITHGKLYEANGAITGVGNEGMVVHTIDTLPCMSGSPIFCKRSGVAPLALGIHTSGLTTSNKGVSINADFVRDFKEHDK